MLPRRAAAFLAAVSLVLLSGCTGSQAEDVDPDQVDAVEAPETGTCRVLDPAELGQPSNATRTVPCEDGHTAETFAVGELPAELQDVEYDSEELETFAFRTCSDQLQQFLGADESTVMRSVLGWAWFRPSEKAWDEGARWYRCDVVGGSETSATLLELPATASGLLEGRPDDDWMVCVDGPSVNTSTKVPCTERHDWRAVTTIKVGAAADAYPGDTAVETTTRDYCQSSVAAWLGYPNVFDFGYTFFHQTEWLAGNRRSICWAATAA